MLDIYICEDNDTFRGYLVKKIKSDIEFTDKDMQIVYDTANPHDLLARITDNHKTNLYFLDIDLNTDIDGIKLAEKIRRFDPEGYLVFVTADGESYRRTFEYKLQALDYIEKTNPDQIVPSLTKVLDYVDKLAAKQNTPQKDIYSLYSAGRTVHVKKDEIITIEIINSSARKLQLQAEYASYSFRGVLTEIYKEISNDDYDYFAKPHQSYIINLKHVERLSLNRTIIVKGGQEYIASRRYWGDFKRRFNYLKQQGKI